MRAEQIDKLKSVVYVINEKFGKIDLENVAEEELEKASKRAFRQAEQNIRQVQSGLKVDGYILFSDVLYKVHFGNTRNEKITGPVAKEIKRRLKQFHLESQTETC